MTPVTYPGEHYMNFAGQIEHNMILGVSASRCTLPNELLLQTVATLALQCSHPAIQKVDRVKLGGCPAIFQMHARL